MSPMPCSPVYPAETLRLSRGNQTRPQLLPLPGTSLHEKSRYGNKDRPRNERDEDRRRQHHRRGDEKGPLLSGTDDDQRHGDEAPHYEADPAVGRSTTIREQELYPITPSCWIDRIRHDDDQHRCGTALNQ